MKAAFISDVHIGPTGYYNDVRRKLTEYSEEYISAFVRHVSESGKYDFAIHLGDLIQDDNRGTDLENYKKGISLFSGCTIPVHHLVGNHDTVHISNKEIAGFSEYNALYYSFDVGLVHVVNMHSEIPDPNVAEIVIGVDQISWLQADLRSSKYPAIIFVHHSLADQDLFGNPWFEGRPEFCLVKNRTDVRKIIRESEKVIAVINGHLHWNRVDMHDGIPYITVQSAVENFNNDGIPANSWGEIEVAGGFFKLEVFGNDTMKFDYRF